MAAQANAPVRDFEFFVGIIDAFKTAATSSETGDAKDMQVAPFLAAMTTFLRIFDAFSNPFFTDVVKKDVEGNIKKVAKAASQFGAMTVAQILDKESADEKLFKLIKKESGIGKDSGTVALLWMKRTMQFVIGLLKNLVSDPAVTLPTASRASYANTLSYCHNFVTRKIFDNGLRFAPSRESFYRNLAGGPDTSKIDSALREFLDVFSPQLQGIVTLYKEKDLEPYIA